MYRAFTFRMRNAPFPVTRYTQKHPDVRAIAYSVGRAVESPLPTDNIYVIRAPTRLHDEIAHLMDKELELIEQVRSPEPGVVIFRARFDPPQGGPMKGFLSVLMEAVGTILEYRPIIIEDGALELTFISLPRNDSMLRVQALLQYAQERGIEFEMVETRSVPTLPIIAPRQTHLDLLEWQVLQSYVAAGAYDDDNLDAEDPEFVHLVAADLAEALGLEDDEVLDLKRAAEHKVLREFDLARRRNIALGTTPIARPRTPDPEAQEATRAADVEKP